jgi:hypothetical protein
MSNIYQYTFLQQNLKEKLKNDKQSKIEQKENKGVVKINPTNLNNYQQILKNEQNSNKDNNNIYSHRNFDYDNNKPSTNQINRLNNQNQNQINRINNLQQISKDKKDKHLKATILKLRSNIENANEEKNM